MMSGVVFGNVLKLVELNMVMLFLVIVVMLNVDGIEVWIVGLVMCVYVDMVVLVVRVKNRFCMRCFLMYLCYICR